MIDYEDPDAAENEKRREFNSKGMGTMPLLPKPLAAE